ncbi:5'-nucleotidase/2',3'-cyclic phosphodiesterase and related esterase [Candidatus Vecturithrix granuli]|uniref:5'-nucleotidase/2',3'-cyclic phosphodiesterase and related esterase n=1 Tax=Vecturithrix granuli TaxID=1499967 RepID=A0A081C192_VECG1|nr:5'-nucleotidase/2',3'-cyclic phosphodiesterase and related esterase [Candidatus Vecturithrix granuli]
MKFTKTSFSAIVFIAVVCLFLSPTISLAKIYHLTILHTNTHSGHFLKFDEYPVHDIRGMAARSTLVNIVRAEVEEAGGHVLLLSAGDVNIGTPESDLLYAEPDFKLMNMLGYDAMAIGNFDLHHPPEVLMQQQEWAGFPFLSANVVKKEAGEILVDPYIVKEYDGLHVAIFGLTVEQADFTSKHGGMFESRSVIETAKKLVPQLRQKADIVIALTHIGHIIESGGSYRTPGDIQLAEEVTEIDVIVGGETNTIFTGLKAIGNTLLVNPGMYGRYVGRLDLTIDSERRKKLATIPIHSFRST